MEPKVRKILVDPANPYENDSMSRESDIKNLSILLRNMKSPAVLSIDAPWGFGKTTFLEMLHADLEANQCRCVCFSAWETDFASEPLLAFLGEINQEIASLIGDDLVRNEAWNKVKEAGSHIIKKGVPAIIRLGTAGVIDIEGALGDDIPSLAGSLSGDLIERYSKDKDTIAKFKVNLKGALHDEGGALKNLYIFVDELDRCRPTYALELLERIKHLFDIEGVIFVLAIDTRQLSHSVRAVYGSEFDSKGYLKRFIDVEYSLLSSKQDDFIDNLCKVFNFDDFFEPRRKYQELRDDRKCLIDMFKLIASAQRYSLRDIEQLMVRTSLVLHATEENVHIYPTLLAFLIMVKESNRDVYYSFIKPESSPDAIIEYLRTLIPFDKMVRYYPCAMLEGLLFSAKGYPHCDMASASLDHHMKNSKNQDCDEMRRDYSNSVIDVMNRGVGIGRVVDFESLVSRMELLEKFKFVTTES